MARHRQSRGAIAREVAEQSLKRQDSTKATRLERIKWREDGGHIIEFGHIYLPHIFTAPSAEFHREICAALATLSRVVRAAPRGHAKTQVATLANTLYLTVTAGRDKLVPIERQRRYILFIQATQNMAEELLDDIRRELEENELLREDFGDLMGGGKWTQSALDCANGVRVRARGAGAAMRGMVKRGRRPDLILGDDIDGEDAAESRAQCEKLKRWWRASVSNLPGAEGGQIFVVGTILHWGALLADILKNEAYNARIYQAEMEHDAAGVCTRTLWPEVWSAERLAARRRDIGSRAYAQEFLNNPVDPATQIFTAELLAAAVYHDETAVGEDWPRYGAVDPAISQKKTADYFVHLTGALGPDGRIWVMDGARGRFDFVRQVEGLLEFDARHNYRRCGIESIAYQDALRQAVARAGQARRQYVRVFKIEQKGRGPKEERIAGLQALFEQGVIRISERLNWLVEALIAWPRGEHDDEADCLEMLVHTIRGTRKSAYSGVGFRGGSLGKRAADWKSTPPVGMAAAG